MIHSILSTVMTPLFYTVFIYIYIYMNKNVGKQQLLSTYQYPAYAYLYYTVHHNASVHSYCYE